MKRGRPRKYPYCKKCDKPIKPGQPFAGEYHAGCAPEGTKARGVMVQIPADAAEIVTKPDEVEKILTTGKRRGRPPKEESVNRHLMKSPNDNGGLAGGYTAREVAKIITDTAGEVRYVVKEGKLFYLTRDPEKGLGEGYPTPTRLLGMWFKAVGMLKIGDQMLYWEKL